jgi:hypothetical protein
MKLGRRSFLKFLGLAPVAPLAVDVTAKALAEVPAKPSGEIILDTAGDFVPAHFTIPPRGIGGLASYQNFVPLRDSVVPPWQRARPKTAHAEPTEATMHAGGKS